MEDKKMIERVTKLEGSMKTIFNDMSEVKVEIKEIKTDNKILHEMNKNIAVLVTNYEHQGKEITAIKSDIKELKDRPIPDITELKCDVKELKERPDATTLIADVKELKERPAKRWNDLTTLIITLIASAVIGFIIGRVLNL